MEQMVVRGSLHRRVAGSILVRGIVFFSAVLLLEVHKQDCTHTLRYMERNVTLACDFTSACERMSMLHRIYVHRVDVASRSSVTAYICRAHHHPERTSRFRDGTQKYIPA